MLKRTLGFLESRLANRSSECQTLARVGRSEDFRNRCLRRFRGAEPKSISISFILLPSMVCVPRAVAILGFAIVEDESFVAFLKHVLNAIRWGFLAIGPTPFEIGFTVNATFVWNGKYEVVAL
jgi:hypothetical protein